MTNPYDEMRVAPDPLKAEELRQRLHARIATVSREQLSRSDLQLDPARLDLDERVVTMKDISSSGRATTGDRSHRRRLMTAAAAIVAALVAVGIAINNQRSDDEDLSTVATTAPAGEEILVTDDSIQLGEGLVGYTSVAKQDDRLYVLAGHADDASELLVHPDTALLAAFNDAGVELWRTELDDSPSGMVLFEGDPWISRDDGTLERIDASDGRVLGAVTIERIGGMVGAAFGSLWVQAGDVTDPAGGAPQLMRVDPDLSTVTIELPAGVASGDSPGHAEAGAGAVWVPLKQGGVAVIDPATNEMTVIPVDDIGHEVTDVAFDGGVAFVASQNQVTSIVDGKPLATASPGEIRYLGPVDGVFGVLLQEGVGDPVEGGVGGVAKFQVLQAEDPIVAEHRQIAIPEGARGGIFEIDGEAWWEVGRNYSLRRVEFLAGDG